MKIKKLFEFRNIIPLLTAAAGIYICVRYAAECTAGIKKGILFCIEVLVPSLYLFMAVSAYLIKSGAAQIIAKPLGGAAKACFRLPPSGLAVILLSLVGGYPVGARCAAMLYEQKQLSETEAQKTAYIAVCAGPGFLLNYVGAALLNNMTAGVILLAAEFAGVLISGFLIGRTIRSAPLKSRERDARLKGGDLLLSSVTDASRATFGMCSMVIVCSAVIEVVSAVSDNTLVTDIMSAFVEITAGCHRLCGGYPLYLIAFFIGFGGISVHLQIYAGLDGLRVNKGLFFLFRIIQGIITAAVTYILLMIFPMEQSVFNSVDAPLTLSRSATLAGSAALVFSSLCFLGSVHQRQLRR